MGSAFDEEPTWALLAEAAREARERAGASPAEVLGIAATGMRHGSVLLDAQGRVLLATPNRDARGLGAALDLAATHGEALHRRTGHWPNPVQPAGRLLWLASNAASCWSARQVIFPVSDWIGFRLCGVAAAEPSQAAETLLFELEQPRWAWDWIERLGLPRRLFPEVRRAGTRLGALAPGSRRAARARAGNPGGGGRRRHPMRSAGRGRGRGRRARRDRGHLVPRALAGGSHRGSTPRRGCGRCRT